jgi:hypothetical protein
LKGCEKLNENENISVLFKIVVVLIIVGAIFGTFMSIVNFALIRSISNEISTLNNLTISSMNDRMNRMDSDISSLESNIQPGGIVDEYINAYNFLSNTNLDLEKLLTFASETPDATYLTVYIEGRSNVWITVTNNGQSLLQADLKPGLSDYVFFISGNPNVKTSYTIMLAPSSIITTSDASATYILLAQNGKTSILHTKSPSLSVSNILK